MNIPNAQPLLFLLLFALSACNSKNNAFTDEELFSFDDGTKTYVVHKETPINIDQTNEPPYQIRVLPGFLNEVRVSEKPLIDTLYDAEDPSIALAIDTIIGTDFKYAKDYSLSYENVQYEFERLAALAAQQELDLDQPKFVVFYEEGGFGMFFKLPQAEDLEDATMVCLTMRLRKDGVTMKYPVLFRG